MALISVNASLHLDDAFPRLVVVANVGLSRIRTYIACSFVMLSFYVCLHASLVSLEYILTPSLHSDLLTQPGPVYCQARHGTLTTRGDFKSMTDKQAKGDPESNGCTALGCCGKPGYSCYPYVLLGSDIQHHSPTYHVPPQSRAHTATETHARDIAVGALGGPPRALNANCCVAFPIPRSTDSLGTAKPWRCGGRVFYDVVSVVECVYRGG